MANIPEAKKVLEAATTACEAARTTADNYADYATMRTTTKATYDGLNGLPAAQKSLITEELTEMERKLTEAAAKADREQKPGDAINLLKAVDTKASEAKVKTEMLATLNSSAPNKDYLKLLMSESGGTKVLDDVVKGLDETKATRNTLAAAIEVRFKCDVAQYLSKDDETYFGTSDLSAPDKSMKRIYELLLKVPDSHARDNPKVNKIRRFQEDTGGASYNSSGRISLNCGRADEGSNHAAQLNSPRYFPDGVDPDCQVRDDRKDADVKYFDWATLHEVGHAVDDKQGFMRTNQAKSEYGGWEVYGDSVDETAAAGHSRFDYDLDYTKRRLRGESPDAVAKPDDVEAAAWEQRKKDVDEWVKIVNGLQLWWQGENSKKVAIDVGGKKRVYQRAYKSKWVSYELDARKQGIHGYQFRAPGEWFAELYAAYYMDMLKTTHPAVKDWLPGKLGS